MAREHERSLKRDPSFSDSSCVLRKSFTRSTKICERTTRGFRGVPGDVGVHRRHAVSKHDDSHNRGRDEQLGVNTEPGKIQADLLPKVLPAEKQDRLT